MVSQEEIERALAASGHSRASFRAATGLPVETWVLECKELRSRCAVCKRPQLVARETEFRCGRCVRPLPPRPADPDDPLDQELARMERELAQLVAEEAELRRRLAELDQEGASDAT